MQLMHGFGVLWTVTGQWGYVLGEYKDKGHIHVSLSREDNKGGPTGAVLPSSFPSLPCI